jgi:P-type conjugative transfer protein TrbG
MRCSLIVCLVFFTVLNAAAFGISPDTQIGTGEYENALLNLFQEGEIQGQKATVAASDTQIPPVPSPSPANAFKMSSSQILDELVKDLESLREKEEITKYTSLSTQKPRTSKQIGATTYYSYQEGAVYEVRAGVDRVTDIALQPGEELTTAPVSGDVVRWKIGLIQSGKGAQKQFHMMVKPLDTDIETNFIVATNKRVYHLRAIASDWYMPAISWHYPDDEAAAMAASLRRTEEEEPIRTRPEGLRFDYKVVGDDYSWKPLRVFDDGQRTYLQMPKSLQVSEAPALFIIEDDQPMLVNYRVKNNYYIVDRLFEQAELRIGTKKKVDIYDNTHRKSFFGRIFD